MLENLFKPKSNDELRTQIKAWTVGGLLIEALMFGLSLYSAFKFPENYAIAVSILLFLTMMPMLIMCITIIVGIENRLRVQTLRQELLSAIEWEAGKTRQHLVDELNWRELQHQKRIVLRSRR